MTGEREKSDGSSRVGTTIAAKYRLDRLLGKGGMGAVYEATHTGIDRKFALKLMHEPAGRASDGEARFEREARAAGRIGHPNIVDVFDFGRTDEGDPYIVMELCAGESLAERVVRGPLPEKEASEIAVEMLRALEAAHAANIVHRDIKPANVFLCEGADGKKSVKVLDFGIAKFVEGDVALTNTGAVIGSPLYMAPEQVRAEKDVDARVDVWSVGATLYELIAGVAAHNAPTHAAVIARIITVPAASLRSHREDIDPVLDAIVLRALAIDREARFATAAAMRVALDKYISGSADTVASMPPVGVSQSTARSSRSATTSVGKRIPLAAIALVLAAVGIGLFFRRPRAVPATAESGTTGSDSAPSPSPSSAIALATSTTALVTAVTSASLPPPTPSAGVIAASSASAHAASTVRSVTPRASSSVTPTCAAGEQPSLGHCCRIGLVWQSDRCDRPLATTAPF